MQYYDENPIPKEIIISNKIDETLKEVLCGKAKKKIIFTIPKKGEKKQLLELVKKNIEIEFFKEEELLIFIL